MKQAHEPEPTKFAFDCRAQRFPSLLDEVFRKVYGTPGPGHYD